MSMRLEIDALFQSLRKERAGYLALFKDADNALCGYMTEKDAGNVSDRLRVMIAVLEADQVASPPSPKRVPE